MLWFRNRREMKAFQKRIGALRSEVQALSETAMTGETRESIRDVASRLSRLRDTAEHLGDGALDLFRDLQQTTLTLLEQAFPESKTTRTVRKTQKRFLRLESDP